MKSLHDDIFYFKSILKQSWFPLCCWAPQRKLPIYFISNKLKFKIQEFIMGLLSEISWVKGQKLGTSSDSEKTHLSIHPALFRNLYVPLYYTRSLKYKVILVCI